MPYAVRHSQDGGYDIVRKDTGEVVGHSATERKARRSIQARYAHEDGERSHPWFKSRRKRDKGNDPDPQSESGEDSDGVPVADSPTPQPDDSSGDAGIA